ncbi:MAG: hypothetical protein Q8R37_04990 [Nanoarchaeota archaeon]|nr:hypothetical protein [Nanoarchaeota archaeon]
MDHVAILSKKGDFLRKIISGEKTIESRWTIPKITPYENISSGDTIYFKESGVPSITARAKAGKTLFFADLNHSKIESILIEFSAALGVDLSYLEKIKQKNYGTLVYLLNVEKIKPFEINKKGYGTGCAWITVEDIKTIKL